MAPRRWLRLDVTWEDSPWLDALDGTAAGCWPRLLCVVKRDGVSGRCKRPVPSVLARRWRVPVDAILALETAAVADGALAIDRGDWVVVKWAEYQDVDATAADRQRRFRADKSRMSGTPQNRPSESNSETKPVTDTARNVTAVTRDPPVTRRVTETETYTETEKKKEPLVPKKKVATRWKFVPDDWRPNNKHWELARSLGLDFDFEVAKFRDHEYDKFKSDPDRTFSNWLRNAAEIKARSGRPPADSQANRVRGELPQQNSTRTSRPVRVDGHDPEAEKLRKERAENERIEHWAKEHPDDASAVADAVQQQIASDPRWTGTPRKIVEGVARSLFRNRVLELLRPAEVA